MPVQAHDPEIKARALALAQNTSNRQAAGVVGVPAGTIARWRAEEQYEGGPPEPKRVPKTIEALTAEARERIITAVAEHGTERCLRIADRLYDVAEDAVERVAVAIGPPEQGGEPHDRDGAAWVRALVGTMAQAVEKAQLLSGRSTSRQESSRTEVRRAELSVQVESLLADPERRETVRQLWRQAQAEERAEADAEGRTP